MREEDTLKLLSINKVVFLILALCMTACSTTTPFHKLPKSSEAFEIPPVQMRQDYPEIPEYEKYFRGFSANTPLIKDLIAEWGEPDKINKQWTYFGGMGAVLIGCGVLFGPVPALIAGGIAIGIRPFPPEYYFWKKGKYCIEAAIDRNIDHLYQKRMIHWRWHELSQSDELSEECKEGEESGTGSH